MIELLVSVLPSYLLVNLFTLNLQQLFYLVACSCNCSYRWSLLVFFQPFVSELLSTKSESHEYMNLQAATSILLYLRFQFSCFNLSAILNAIRASCVDWNEMKYHK